MKFKDCEILQLTINFLFLINKKVKLSMYPGCPATWKTWKTWKCQGISMQGEKGREKLGNFVV